MNFDQRLGFCLYVHSSERPYFYRTPDDSGLCFKTRVVTPGTTFHAFQSLCYWCMESSLVHVLGRCVGLRGSCRSIVIDSKRSEINRRATARRQDQYLTQYIQDRLEPLHILDSWTPSSFGMHPRAAIARRGVCFGSIVPTSRGCRLRPSSTHRSTDRHRATGRRRSSPREPRRRGEQDRTEAEPLYIYSLRIP